MATHQIPVDLAFYLWTRLHQMGVRSVHGVPGDYNLNLLDRLSSAGLRWVGNCNELNAGYACDGYARIKGIGAMVTTGGVGELSAINAHAGAYVERVSLIHIVGTPSLRIRKEKNFAMHHTLGNGHWNIFTDMFVPISASQVILDDPTQAPKLIDSVLKQCWVTSRPVYIGIPSDMPGMEVDGSSLKIPLDMCYPQNDEPIERQALSVLQQRLDAAQKPCFLVDLSATRQRINGDLNRLIAKSGIPAFVTPLAQSTIDESLDNYAGLYAGAGSGIGVQQFVEDSDLVLHIGKMDTDVTTYLGSAKIKSASHIVILEDVLQIDDSTIHPLHLRSFLLAMLNKLDFSKVSISKFHIQESAINSQVLPVSEVNAEINQAWLWRFLGHWLRQGDIILTDTGTASFGIFDTQLPSGSLLVNISLWASIGYSLPSAQGAALAAADTQSSRRTIVFQGDGSFQLTCQEISTMVKHKLNVFIFVICNNGYTIERAVHKTSETYNDIAEWSYRNILSVFDPSGNASRSFTVKTKGDLSSLLTDDEFSQYRGVQLIELYTPELDIPIALKRLAEQIEANQAPQSSSVLSQEI